MSALLRASKKLYIQKSNVSNLLLKNQTVNTDNRILNLPASSYSSLTIQQQYRNDVFNINNGSTSSPSSFSPSSSSFLNVSLGHQLSQSRDLSSNKGGFFGQVMENIKQEFEKNKEMKENLKKFREEAQKLEESDALKQARKKFQTIESETSKGSEKILEQFDTVKEKLEKGFEEVGKTELGKKGKEAAEQISKTAKMAAEQIENISKSEAFQTVSKTAKTIKQEIGETPLSGARLYRPPEVLRKRKEYADEFAFTRPIEPNDEATGVELHKDSKWFSSWQDFKDNNQYVHKIFDLKAKYDESDNPLVRASRLVTDTVTDVFGGFFSKTEMSEVLTEICKVDPNFDRHQFLKECETDIIPNILEAMIRGDLDILQDWCYEAPFNVLATPIRQAQEMKYKFESRILDLTNLELEMGKMMEQGPVLIITFQTQQIMVVKNAKGDVVEGDPDKIVRVHYVWVLCRDQNELDPKAAWKLLDLSANSSEQWI